MSLIAGRPSLEAELSSWDVSDGSSKQVQTVEQPSAILDIRFHPASAFHDVLAVVSSTGTLAIFKFDPTLDSSSPLQHVSTSSCDDLGGDVLFLQCNWHPVKENLIGVTTSTGAARLLLLDEQYRITEQVIDLDISNSLEAWCIAFSPASEDSGSQVMAYCGGDDSMLRYTSCEWDQSQPESPHQTPFSPVTIRGSHGAGVTAILPLSIISDDGGRIVLTGSYDDHLRVFIVHDLHQSFGLKRVQMVLEENLGGGVWRLDLVEIREQDGRKAIRVLASCMHAGARLVEIQALDDQSWTCEVLARFEEHKSMNYGSDFVRPVVADKLRCVSTSFYDKLLCLWEYEGQT